VRKFFLEAKKPSISIKNNAEAAFQVRRYGWSAKLPVSLLSNFAELAVYDCRIKPLKTDNAAQARILYLTYTNYLERWDELLGLFSREAILKGAFDQYIESQTSKKATATVDTAFLSEIERWRERLARNIALRNPDLIAEDLKSEELIKAFLQGRDIRRFLSKNVPSRLSSSPSSALLKQLHSSLMPLL
jgi:hypothetical protein